MSEQKFSTLDIAFPLTGKNIVALTQTDTSGVKVSTQVTLAKLLDYMSFDLTFDDVNEGLKNTSNQQYFKVRNKLTNVMDVYRNEDGVAVRIEDEIAGSVSDAEKWAKQAKESADKAAQSVTDAKVQTDKSEASAKESAESAKDSANNAVTAKEAAAAADKSAKDSAGSAKESAESSIKSDKSAKDAAESAKKAEESSKVIQNVLDIYKVVDKGEVGDRIVLHPDEAGMQSLTLMLPNTSVNLDAVVAPTNIYRQIVLYIKQGTGANKVVWDNKISWSNGRIPTLSYRNGATDIVTLVTINNGNTWFGMYNGGWFNVQ